MPEQPTLWSGAPDAARHDWLENDDAREPRPSEPRPLPVPLLSPAGEDVRGLWAR